MSTSSFLCFTYHPFKCSVFIYLYLYYLSGNLFNCLLKSLYTFVFEYYDVRSLDNMIFSIPNVLKDIRCTFDSIQSTKAIEKTNLQSNCFKKKTKKYPFLSFLICSGTKAGTEHSKLYISGIMRTFIIKTIYYSML